MEQEVNYLQTILYFMTMDEISKIYDKYSISFIFIFHNLSINFTYNTIKYNYIQKKYKN